MSARPLYVDSSALVKLVIEEPESAALERHLGSEPLLATSCIAVVEVSRATSLANPAPEVKEAAEALLAACMLVDLKDALPRAAAALASTSVRTLDAIHLASALKLGSVEFVAYDRRLAAAAVEHGLSVASPGAGSRR